MPMPRFPPDKAWPMAGAFVAGGIVSVVPMALIISALEGGPDLTGIDGDLYGTIPMALLGGTVAVLLRRRPVAASFASGWFLLQAAFTATFSEADWLVAALLPAFWATLLLDLPAPLRIAMALPTTLTFMLAADLVSSWSAAWAAVSGIVAMLLGGVYFVWWGLIEGTRWASHLAWTVAAAWAALGFVLALVDLFEFLDAVAIAGAVATLILLCGIGFAWVLTQDQRTSAPAVAQH